MGKNFSEKTKSRQYQFHVFIQVEEAIHHLRVLT